MRALAARIISQAVMQLPIPILAAARVGNVVISELLGLLPQFRRRHEVAAFAVHIVILVIHGLVLTFFYCVPPWNVYIIAPHSGIVKSWN